MNKREILFTVCALCLPAWALADVTLTVTNTENVQRQELVEISAKDVYQKLGIGESETFVVKNALKQEVDYQLTHDGKLLIDVSVRPCGSAQFTIAPGKPKAPKVYVTGKMYPERVDDIAWEVYAEMA
jgi:hypothetical protein